ncbi:MAG: septal junction protein FraD [Cyanobacteria bacterium P01_D01_bin.50]
MGVIRETLNLLGLNVLFDFIRDIIGRIKYIFIPPKAFSWQTLIYLSVFSWLMSSLARPGSPIQDIIAFFGWIFLVGGTSWYTTDKPLYIPGTVMPVGAVITGGIVSLFAFGRDEAIVARTIIFWPTISAMITAVPEFFEGSGTDVKAQLPKLEDRESVIVLIGCCMLLSCWLNLYGVTDKWLSEYPSAKYPIYRDLVAQRNDLLTVLEPENKTPKNGILILEKLQSAVETKLDGKSWSDVELWLKSADKNASQIGRKVIDINLAEFEEKDFWKVEARVDNIDPKDINSYKLELFSVWQGPSAAKDGYYLKKSCQIEPIAESIDTIGGRSEKMAVAEIECLPKISYIAGQPTKK